MPDPFAVNGTTHKQWIRRQRIITLLADWVYANLDLSKPSRKPGETDEERQGKAYQYVYEHFAVGKMKHPEEHLDPLFTHAKYTDLSMQWLLNPGLYPEFQDYVQYAIRLFAEFKPNEADEVTYESAKAGLSTTATDLVNRVRQDLAARHRFVSDEWLDNEMTGLIVRYNCMGGFSDNLHGSVPPTWTTALPGFIECFASPFNHKFPIYFSLYKSDQVFGSRGSFFEWIADLGGVLPTGNYEMNPPWNNEMYEKLV